jgi:Antibiotic biosynthesis monooxygenase
VHAGIVIMGILHLPSMITLQRRWFVPSDKLDEFRRRWDAEIKPRLLRQPGFVRGELYESDVRGDWLTAISWQDEQSLAKALDDFSDVYREFQRFERFGPEKLTLLSGSGRPAE